MEALAIETPKPTSHITAKVEVITPALAAELLRNQARQRPVSRTHVRQLVRAIKEGKWVPNHQGLALNHEGKVMDGQHRLLAIVEADEPVELLVSYDVPEEAFGVIDQHRRRTAAQLLSMHGASKDPSRVVPMARAILTIVEKRTGLTHSDVADYAVAYLEHFEPFLRVAKQFSPACGAAFAWCHMLGWHETLAAAERLATNGPWEEPQETDPMRALANRTREFERLGSGQTRIQMVFDITLNALVALHDRRGLKHVKSNPPNYEKIRRDSLIPRDEEEIESFHPPRLATPSASLFPQEPEPPQTVAEAVSRNALQSLQVRDSLAEADTARAPAKRRKDKLDKTPEEMTEEEKAEELAKYSRRQ